MSFDDVFGLTNRRHNRGESRVSRHERRAVKRGARNLNVVQGVDPAAAHVETTVSQVSRAMHIPLRVFVGARVLGASLDNKLAAGHGPETSHLLAARAQLIVSKARRRKLAENWLALLVESHESSGRRDGGVPLLRDGIVSARNQILALADALLAPLPTSRGVAMANSLLSDGAGPIFHWACSADLGSTLREVIARLDPMTA